MTMYYEVTDVTPLVEALEFYKKEVPHLFLTKPEIVSAATNEAYIVKRSYPAKEALKRFSKILPISTRDTEVW